MSDDRAVDQNIGYLRVLKLAVPIVLANLTQPILSMVDTAIAGHFKDMAELGGVALGGLIFSFIFWGFGFLRMSTTGLIAQAFGGHYEIALHQVLWRAALLAVAIGALILLANGPVINLATTFLTDRPELIQQASSYCHARIWSAPLALGNYVILGYLLGVQQVRSALLLQIIVNLCNVIAALLLVYVAHFGVAGLGAATASADLIGFLAGIVVIGRRSPRLLELPRAKSLLDTQQLKRLLLLNVNLFGRTMCLLAVFAWFTRASAAVSVATLAGNTVLLNFQTFMAYGLDGFAQACEALVGAAIGARNRLQLMASIRSSTVLAAVVAIAFAVVYATFGRAIINALTSLPAVRLEANAYLPYAACSPLISVWGFQLDGVFIGATRTRDLVLAMIGSCAVFVAAQVLFSNLGNLGLWLAFLSFMAARGATLALLLPRLVRQTILGRE